MSKILDLIKADFKEKCEAGDMPDTEYWEGFIQERPTKFLNFDLTIMEDDIEGEGGREDQSITYKFQDGNEIYFVRFPVTWVSWDGFYYDYTLDGMSEVVPVQKIITVYENV